jgi:hypothetical protein
LGPTERYLDGRDCLYGVPPGFVIQNVDITKSSPVVDGFREAVSRMTPMVRASVSNVAFVKWPPGSDNRGNFGKTFGTSILINFEFANDKAHDWEYSANVLHEAAHALTHVYEAVLGTPRPRSYTNQYEIQAAAKLEEVRDDIGSPEVRRMVLGVAPPAVLSEHWMRLHDFLVNRGRALPPGLGLPPDAGTSPDLPDIAANNGYANGYGARVIAAATFPHDDIAEYTVLVQMPEYQIWAKARFRGQTRAKDEFVSVICDRVRAWFKKPPAALKNDKLQIALIMEKLEALVRDGFVDEERRAACTGGADLRGLMP